MGVDKVNTDKTLTGKHLAVLGHYGADYLEKKKINV
jgi:hypothetical protein